MTPRGRWGIGLLLILIATAGRLCWVLAVPTIPVGDFATYRESAMYLAEFGRLDSGFVYMPGWVLLLAAVHAWGGEVLAGKLLGVAFGGLAAGPLYLVAARFFDNGRVHEPEQPPGGGAPSRRGWTRGAGAAAAGRQVGTISREDELVPLAAGLAYALWPAGIAVSSVVGTDIPTAAVILLALAFLYGWGAARPLMAAVTFGAAMGVAAYFRAVALPLTLLSVGYWGARGTPWRATVVRTGAAVAMTVLMLLPWGLRNRRHNGEFYLTDSHGGITALMGSYPNSEGTHSRALATLFQQLTGRTFLMEPHRITDRAAYALAKQWMKFDPAWTVGMVALRTERLFAPERGLLYWPVYRPGVLPAPTTAWFNQHRREITWLVDWFYLLFAAGVVSGIAFAAVERRWTALALLPFALALAATYALFVAEPRYRLTTEVLLFPLFGLGVVRLAYATAALARGSGQMLRVARGRRRHALLSGAVRSAEPLVAPPLANQVQDLWRSRQSGMLATVLGLAVLLGCGLLIVRGGEWLRRRHRWAATVWTIDGQPQLAMWRSGGGPSDGDSVVRGGAPGAAVSLSPGADQATAQVVLPNWTGSARRLSIEASVSWRGGTHHPGTFAAVGNVRVPAGAAWLAGVVDLPPTLPVRLPVRVWRTGAAIADAGEVLFADVRLTAEGRTVTKVPRGDLPTEEAVVGSR